MATIRAKVSKSEKNTEPMQVSTPSVEMRAYQIWLEEGRPDGKALEHWLQAEHEVSRNPTAVPTAARVARSKEAERRV